MAALRPIPDRVQAGVELLDRELPGWEHRIDLDQLRLESPCHCVLGQLFNNSFDDGVDQLGLLDVVGVPDQDLEVALGFESGAAYERDEYRRLTDAWRNRIEARRAKAGDR